MSLFLRKVLVLFFLFVTFSLGHALHEHHNKHSRHLPSKESVKRRSEDAVVTPSHESLGSSGFTLREPRALFARQQAGGGSNTATSGDYTCGPGKPCGNKSCCGASGWCGYGPKFCGEGCQSYCDAKAECGQYAKTSGQGCPLNVCCSEHGFCGTTQDFCGSGCQSNCKQPKPNGGTSNSRQIVIGYYEGWNLKKKCGSMTPEEIPVHSLTHLIFSFGFIAPGTFKIENMPDFQPSLFGRVTDLKQKKPSLKVLIALGGWTHNDPGKYQKVFSNMASTAANRKTFIANLMGFMAEYGFDGVDLDWEYPGAEDRGGVAEDGANLTQLLKELKEAMGKRYILTFTAPTSYWYLRHFDIKKSAEIADWVNLMSYDLHGVWDRDNPIGNRVLGHTNLTEIDLALDLFWRNDVPPNKIVLGTGFYGRSFRLTNGKCWTPGCEFSGPGEKGECTDTEGFLSYKEVKDILAATKARPKLDKEAGIQYMTYGQNSWISYDDPKTIEMKVDFANKRGLKGLMTWAIDIDDEKGDLIRALTGSELQDEDDLLQFMTDNGPSIAHGTADGSQCYISDCGTSTKNATCKDGYTPVGRCNTDQNGKNRCNTRDSRQARKICCPSFSGPQENDCRWDDKRSTAARTDCSAKCDIGEINVINDSFGWSGDLLNGGYADQCSRGWKSFCCKAGNMKRYLEICTWTECNKSCPSDKPFQLTTDTGGPKNNPRCGWKGSGDPFNGEGSGIRRLCCPRKKSFGKCNWESAKVCSSTCALGKITLDLDPRGPDPRSSSCHNGREQAYCCEPPGGFARPFAPFNLENLFPEAQLPPADAIPSYDLVSFGGMYAGFKDEDPNHSGVAFFLIAGHSSAVSSMKKRDIPGLEFLDCPHDILERPDHELQTARIICMQSNVTDCFRVEENGVEGTIVQMPDECGGPSWSRAVSLTLSADQTIPDHISERNPTSAVYDFKFDYNIGLVRRDTGRLSIRLDYSNVPGYWYAVVDTPGKKKRDLNTLVERFYGNSADWYAKFNGISFNDNQGLRISEKLDKLVYHNGQTCHYNDVPEGGGDIGESVSIAVQGSTDVALHYGFSMIATWEPGSEVKIHQAAGFVRPTGKTDVTFKMGGSGVIDTAKSLQGSTITKTFGKKGMAGHNIYKGWAFFTAYKEMGVQLRSGNGKAGAVPFSGYMEARVKADWGRYNVNFPGGATFSPHVGPGEGGRDADEVSKSDKNKLVPVETTPTGFVEVGTTIRFGLQAGMSFSEPYQSAVGGELPDMSVSQYEFARWFIENKDKEACLSTSLGSTMQSVLAKGTYAGWNMDKPSQTYVQELNQAGSKECFDGEGKKNTRRAETSNFDEDVSQLKDSAVPGLLNLVKRQELPNDPIDWGAIPLPGTNLLDKGWNGLNPILNCNGCGSCTLESSVKIPCCGCTCLPCRYGFYPDYRPGGEPDKPGFFIESLDRRALPNIDDYISNNLTENIGSDELEEILALHRLMGRADPAQPSSSTKPINFCGGRQAYFQYPAYPDLLQNENSPVRFDTHPDSLPVMKYFHNATASCTSWAVARFATADRVYDHVRRRWRPQFYQTEHPFEAQTISRFFGRIDDDNNDPHDCNWILTNIVNDPNSFPGASGTVIAMMSRELGGWSRRGFRWDQRQRLAAFLTNSNRLKGQISGDRTPGTGDFTGLQAGDEQLMFLREFGMIFAYWNHPDVWDSWCATYNGIRDILIRFDAAYGGANPVPANLAQKWADFSRRELNDIARIGRAYVDLLYSLKKPVGGIWGYWWDLKWYTVMTAPLLNQRSYIKFTNRCANLPT